MNSVAQVLQELDEERLALLNAVESVPADLRGKHPGQDRWSVAEVLEHLSIVERRSNIVLKKVVKALRAGESMNSSAPQGSPARAAFSKATLQDRSRKVEAVVAVQPSGTVAVESSLESLAASRAELKSSILAFDEPVLASHAVDHPVFGPLNVAQWIEFLAGHEARHTAQILEIALQLKQE